MCCFLGTFVDPQCQVRLPIAHAGVACCAWRAKETDYQRGVRPYLGEPDNDVVTEGLATLHFTGPILHGIRRRTKFGVLLK